MGNPLQDQLLKAGLVTKKQAGKVKRKQYLNKKQKSNKNSPSKSDNKARTQQVAQAERNRELNRQQAAKKQQQEKKAQIKQLIGKNRLKLDGNGDPYYFSVEKQIHRIFVSDEIADQLSRGQLAIVQTSRSFEIVPVKVALQIAERDKGVVVALHKE